MKKLKSVFKTMKDTALYNQSMADKYQDNYAHGCGCGAKKNVSCKGRPFFTF